MNEEHATLYERIQVFSLDALIPRLVKENGWSESPVIISELTDPLTQ